jgi:hypothetical protein
VTVNETVTAFDSVTGGTPRDGVTYVAGDRVLLVNQTAAAQNGVWVVGVVAVGVAPLTRPPDWQSGATLLPNTVIQASEGTQGANGRWLVTTTGAITIDTTAIALAMPDGNWIQGVSTATGTQAAGAGIFVAGALLKARTSGIFRLDVDVSYSNNTTADPVTVSLISDTAAAGAGAILSSANKVAHGVAGFGAFGTAAQVADWESVDTNAGAKLQFNAADWSTAPVTQKSDVNGTLTGLLTTNGSGTMKFSFHGLVYNAAPTGTTKTPFTIGNACAFGLKFAAAAGTITFGSVAMSIQEMPTQ